MKRFLSIVIVGTMTASTLLVAQSNREVVLASEVKWEKLNPARGDKSPQAATLWGDRKGSVATGFLAKFVDGFSSPPHIHNVSYRAVVIKGKIHNDDPDAAPMWMPKGSFWTQPMGEVHITAAMGTQNIALVEIDKGPYLVRPIKKAFDNGERPINIDASNIVWVDLPSLNSSVNSPKIAYLWGDIQDGMSKGSFIKFPVGFSGKILSHGSNFRAVVIEGKVKYLQKDSKTLTPGSYFASRGEAEHHFTVESEDASIVYIRTNGKFEVHTDK